MAKKPTKEKPDHRLIHFKTALEHSSDAIGISTPEGHYWYQNEAFRKLFGEIGSDPPVRIFVDEQVGREVFRTIMKGGQWWGEVEMFGKTSNILNVWLRAYAIKDEKDEVVGLVGTHTDITARKQAEEALREREENLRAILAANPDPMVIYDTIGTPQYLNPAFTDVFGWTLAELKGHRIPFVPDSEEEITGKKIREIYRVGSVTSFESQRYTKTGGIRDVIISAAITRGTDNLPSGLIVNLTDISERKSLQAQYEQAQKMESLGTLAGGIAHDFNNLLMGIQGRASLMVVDLDPGHPHYEHIKGIEKYVQSATQLTRQLLGFARGGKYEVKAIDLNELIKTDAEMFARTRKEIRINTKLQDTTLSVEVDREQIGQVLLNIFVNAWQAMPGGGTLFIETQRVILEDDFCIPYQAEPGPYASVAITDTGIGMHETIQSRIFDPFFTTKEKGRGTGLGLASAYGVIKNHNGFLTVSSDPGQGATFTIYLPLTEKVSQPERSLEGKLQRGSETILLVDDEDIIAEVGRSMLEMLGYTVLSAGSGREAVEVVRTDSDKIDLIILDMIMPEMDGGKTFDCIREIQPHAAVLLSSGYAMDGQAETIMRKGCSGFIQKPFTILALSETVREILDRH